MFRIRTSKYRHVFCDAPKPEHCFQGFRLSTATGDQQYIKASAKYFVVALDGGGGPMSVGRLDRPGRFEAGTCPEVHGHTGSVLDFDFNPFDDAMFASASEDTTIKIWSIPDDWEPTDESGLAKAGTNLKESIQDLTGHKKKVTLLRFHPSASNVLASTSADYTVKVWDVEKGEEISSFEDFSDLIQDIVWNPWGEECATTCKDKVLRFLDPRTGKMSKSVKHSHDGLKSMKVTYLGDSGKLLTTGASRQNAREMKIWDIKNLTRPLSVENIDTASGALLPLYDNDTSVLYLCGKGDGIIRPYESDEIAPFVHRLNEGFRSSVPAKGMCLVPKRGLNIMECESARILKLTNNEGIHPLSLTVPRKSDAFQDDIYPDCPSTVPAHTAEEWTKGSSKPPKTMSLDPINNVCKFAKTTEEAQKIKLRTVATVSAELKEAQGRIQYLESMLTKAGVAF